MLEIKSIKEEDFLQICNKYYMDKFIMCNSPLFYFVTELSLFHLNEDNYIINKKTKDFIRIAENMMEIMEISKPSYKKYSMDAIKLGLIKRLPDRRLVINPLFNKKQIEELNLFIEENKEYYQNLLDNTSNS